jgi:DNA-directed RNA polymerase subunit beta
MVKVYLAIKRKLSVGDKMAGRHGNKGVVSAHPPGGGHAVPRRRHAGGHRAQPARRPSRMNVGQILETHLGWGARELGRQIAAMVEKESPR